MGDEEEEELVGLEIEAELEGEDVEDVIGVLEELEVGGEVPGVVAELGEHGLDLGAFGGAAEVIGGAEIEGGLEGVGAVGRFNQKGLAEGAVESGGLVVPEVIEFLREGDFGDEAGGVVFVMLPRVGAEVLEEVGGVEAASGDDDGIGGEGLGGAVGESDLDLGDFSRAAGLERLSGADDVGDLGREAQGVPEVAALVGIIERGAEEVLGDAVLGVQCLEMLGGGLILWQGGGAEDGEGFVEVGFEFGLGEWKVLPEIALAGGGWGNEAVVPELGGAACAVGVGGFEAVGVAGIGDGGIEILRWADHGDLVVGAQQAIGDQTGAEAGAEDEGVGLLGFLGHGRRIAGCGGRGYEG